MMNDRHEWFAPKRYGIGAGLPIAWQGWLVTIAFMVAVLGTAYIFEDRPLVVVAIVLPLVAVMLVVASRTTRGGWRWRWGGRE
ncbi:hypothetical protein [Sphingomonas edaphi]|uniref:Uncharacterized protein n=1 Tax=Sphingomonas edaphi TaxID=2315689 RepID=A0A418Q3W6_9SPHN|nr:hypothetical protein [Sphingomonas edaphi]RIX32599.1 hypothetical protein D3M59_06665 [Sphingomonas edaphi]